NMSYHTGNDTYNVTPGIHQTIWDAGGVDTLSAVEGRTPDGSGAVMDMRPGTLSTFLGGSGQSGVTGIAFNVDIENAIGSPFDDIITGNALNNHIDGGGGADHMFGGAGDDTYIVDNTGDVVGENPGAGNDTIESSVTYTLPANVENLTLTGGITPI